MCQSHLENGEEMNLPIMLAFVSLVGWGIAASLMKVAGANQVYSPSYMIVVHVVAVLVGIVIHLVQSHSFELSPRMAGLAALGGISAGIAFWALLVASRLGGEGSVIFPIAGLSVIIPVLFSFIVFREPVTSTRVLGLGLGISSIVVLSR